jgi:ribosomal protein S18 acetylase RimI-like enzyme
VLLMTVDHHDPPTVDAVSEWLRQLTASGVDTVRTGALGPSVRPVYLEAGFAVRQELVLLCHHLGTVPAPRRLERGIRLGRPGRGSVAALADLDRRAFGQLWGFDATGVDDAVAATPVARIRVATEASGLPVGYAISGQAGAAAYLQRLAVDPGLQGRGLGWALTVDALRWAQRRRARSVLVNTHVGNDRALGLYRTLGFEELGYRLAVLEWRAA